ncbi:MAG: hypothetical protein HC836_34655 [Richelia sp. RM2_1_2]|nr:hypothetical protein [Richelia sp. RM2_1_2]
MKPITAADIKEACEALQSIVNEISKEKEPYIVQVTIQKIFSDTAITDKGIIYRRHALFHWGITNVGDVVNVDSRTII